MRTRWWFVIVAGCLLAGLGFWLAGRDGPAAPDGRELSVAAALGANEEAGYARATQPRIFRFPDDHGPHPRFKTEWWYYTGNLLAENNRHFGYQLTFFRIALRPAPPERPSAWATNQVYMAHFALTDTAGETFHAFERFSRAALGLAGARTEPFRVWLEDWSAAAGPDEAAGMTLQAAAGEVAIDLRLAPVKPIVLQGENGLSQKSAAPGNASYYYSLTRLATAGQIRIADETFTVRGHSWLDREWSTSALGLDQVGWDWFSLQFEDGRELMYYQLRRIDGSADPLSRGVLIGPGGAMRSLTPAEVGITVLDDWQSPHSSAVYPAAWRLQIAAADLDLQINPVLADQELPTTVRYWEGAVTVRGEQGERPVRGRGYVELTGY